MAAYSMDLRTRVLADCDAGMRAEDVAAKYRVSRAWVHRLLQRRRETGEIGPRHQTKFRARRLDGEHEDRLRNLVTAQPDRTPRRAAGGVIHSSEPGDDLACAGAPEIDR